MIKSLGRAFRPANLGRLLGNSLIWFANFVYRNLWIALFYIIVLALAGTFFWNNEGELQISLHGFFQGVRGAILIGLILMVFHGLVGLGRPGIWRRSIAAIPAVAVCALSFSELWMLQMLHSRWSDRIIRLIADTDNSEAGEFFTNYLFSFRSFAIFIACLLFFIALYDVLRVVGNKMQDWRPKALFSWLAVGLAGVGIWWWSLPPENNYNALNSTDSFTRICKMVKLYRWSLNNVKALERTPRLADGKMREGFTPPARIIWVIGESDSKAHWSAYGYRMPTTPRIDSLRKNDGLIIFDDVISFEPRTYRMMELMFSPFVVTQHSKEYVRQPLTPMLLRKAGYTVRLHDNQATLVRGDDQAEIGTGNFMNSWVLSNANFDWRNEQMYRYDAQLFESACGMLNDSISPTFDIFHINGQHFSAVKRYPQGFGRFSAANYNWRPDLSMSEKQQVAEYDNATLYLDSILMRLIEMVSGQDAVIIYHPDHGEEMNDERHCSVRTMDSHKIRESAPYVLEIPFVVYATPEFQHLHPEMYDRLKQAASRKWSVAYVSQFLLDLAGVESRYFKPGFSPLSDQWTSPPRLVKEIGDYDRFMGRK